jgi:hypothetical protein
MLQALWLDTWVRGRLELSLPGEQHGVSKRAGGFFSHGVAPNSDSPVAVMARQSF